MLGFLDCLFEVLSIFKTARLLVFIKIFLTIFILPCLRMFGDINHLRVFEPDILNIDRKFMNNVLEDFDTLNR